MTDGLTSREWGPGPIGPKPVNRTVSTSVRMPEDLYEELGRYAEEVRAPRSYLIVECVRRLIADYKAQTEERARSAARSARPARR